MAMTVEQSYIDIYKQYRNTLCAKSAATLNEHRDEAFRTFENGGFPYRNEEYRHTDLAKAFDVNYGMNINRVPLHINSQDVFKCEVQDIKSFVFFVVNDTFYCPESSAADLAELRSMGVLVGSLHEYATSHPEIVAKYYNQITPKTDGYVAFNTAFAQDGFFLYVPKNVEIPRPIQLITVMQAAQPTLANVRNLIIVDENARAQVLVCAHAMSHVSLLSNRVTEVFVGKGATYDHYRIENTLPETTAASSLYIRQDADSNTLVNDITLHNGLTRNNVQIDLDGQHAETLLCGMVVADGNEHTDNATLINHNVPNCKSRELYKYVLDGKANGVFFGKILVAKDAQKTEAFQTNRNVCMKPTARMFTQPQLEIYADDVKCSHGASTGVMDDNALFYLRSRGIPEHEARMLLMYAFVNDVIENVRIDALKSQIRQLVEKRFRGELPRCSNCNVCK